MSFSKQSLWNMPVFIGISKSSYHREYLSHTLSKSLGRPETREQIKAEMTKLVNDVLRQYAGTVPPTYLLTSENTPQAAPNTLKEKLPR